VRQVSKLEMFMHTKGYTRTPLTLSRLEQATRFRQVVADMEPLRPEFERVVRGLKILMDGLTQTYPDERIHQFVRSLEALILPEPGQTKRQFVHRCQTFAKAGTATRTILEEAFDLRSNTEHLHPGIVLYSRTWQTCRRMSPYTEPGNWRRWRVLRTREFLRTVRSENISGMKQSKATSGGRWTMPPEERHGASNSTSRA